MIEKYRNLARDAQLAGDRVQTEYYLQFADHYFRVVSDFRARQEEKAAANGQERSHDRSRDIRGVEDFDGHDDTDGDIDSAAIVTIGATVMIGTSAATAASARRAAIAMRAATATTTIAATASRPAPARFAIRTTMTPTPAAMIVAKPVRAMTMMPASPPARRAPRAVPPAARARTTRAKTMRTKLRESTARRCRRRSAGPSAAPMPIPMAAKTPRRPRPAVPAAPLRRAVPGSKRPNNIGAAPA